MAAKGWLFGIFAAVALVGAAWGQEQEEPPERELALELFDEGQFAASAIEFRRLGLEGAPDGAGWLWMAARAYAQPNDVHAARLASKMLDEVEDADPAAALVLPVTFLRAELALKTDEAEVARFYFNSLGRAAEDGAAGDDAAAWSEYAARGEAAASLRGGDLARARSAVADYPEAVATVDAYAEAGRKRPMVGGLLGLVPGLGYAYSGEYANALRSLLLNGLFIWGMVDTAIDDEWALFGICTFFETTWYTGSIYGGIDAAHRHNKRELEETVGALRPVQPSAIAPDETLLPIIRLQFAL